MYFTGEGTLREVSITQLDGKRIIHVILRLSDKAFIETSLHGKLYLPSDPGADF